MRSMSFYKYQGTGNDFILCDDRNNEYSGLTTEQIAFLCDRRFGIGADGLMMLRSHEEYDFEMKYFNSDGRESTMCGNGGRCIVAYAQYLKIINSKTIFKAIDGIHEADIDHGIVRLKMQDIAGIETGADFYFLDTGSPHYVCFIDNLETLDVNSEGRKIRYNSRFAEVGTNVNFVEYGENILHIRTYERGVENETLSCGTGSVAAAIAASLKSGKATSGYLLKTKGGDLSVRFKMEDAQKYTDVWLEGPATQVFRGFIEI